MDTTERDAMRNELDPKQWCELHGGHSDYIRAVRVGGAAADRFTVMVCPRCAKELVDYGWAYPTQSFHWDFIFPSVSQYYAVQAFIAQP
jgi:hypothetical protein